MSEFLFVPVLPILPLVGVLAGIVVGLYMIGALEEDEGNGR